MINVAGTTDDYTFTITLVARDTFVLSISDRHAGKSCSIQCDEPTAGAIVAHLISARYPTHFTQALQRVAGPQITEVDALGLD